MHAPLELVLLLHLHLPSGSSREACQRAWVNCFSPLLGALHGTPDARAGLVLAGELVQELQTHHPEAIEWIRGLVDRGQVELVGTALYEPVLSAIPERDAVGQMNVHAAQIRKVFGVRPRGCWLPHGLWEPTLPRVLAQADMAWAAVPDRHLEAVGEPEGEVNGVYRTEREGHTVALLPVDARLQEVAAEVPVKQVLAHLGRRARHGHRMVGLGLFGSRFGLHPGSSPQQDQAWFQALLIGVAKAHRAVEARLPSQAVALGASRGRVYLPTLASPGVDLPWERFLVRYTSANRLHKKMLRVSRLIQKLDRYLGDEGSRIRPDPTMVEQARRYLYRGQTSAAYWHHRHAGLYDPAIRELAWKDVLRGEHTALQAMQADDRLIVERADLDCDGVDEVLLFTPDAAMVVDPARGAAISELSVVSLFRNLADTVTRVAEPYHSALPDDDAMRAHLVADDRPRALFTERFLGPDDSLEQLRDGTYTEQSSRLSEGLWEVVSAERHGSDAVRAVVQRDGVVHDAQGDHRVRLQKRYTLRQRTLNFRRELTNRGRDPLVGRHALELNVFLDADPSAQRLVLENGSHAAGEEGDRGMVEIVRLEAAEFAVEIHLLQRARLWHYPLRSVYRHLGAWHDTVQGICLLLVQDVALDGGKKVRFDLKMKVEA